MDDLFDINQSGSPTAMESLLYLGGFVIIDRSVLRRPQHNYLLVHVARYEIAIALPLDSAINIVLLVKSNSEIVFVDL